MDDSGGQPTEDGVDETISATHATAHERSDLSSPLARGAEIGRYLVVQELGRGATGRVWVAYDADLDRKVAIKIVAEPIAGDPATRKRLLGEAQAMARIRHPNVVSVHDVGTHQGRLYIAMEYVEGTTLRQWGRDATRGVREILDAFDGAARGLAAAHASGLVHRDFKPDNVLIDRDGRARVLDFGLALAVGPPSAADEGEPSQGRLVGTPSYMSPEHFGDASVDARSDQFSYCVALFESLTGQRPFAGSTVHDLARATLAGEIDPVATARLPRRLRGPILRGLARRPEARHTTMEALIDALARARRPRWPWIAAPAALTGAVSLLWSLRADAPAVAPCDRGTEIAAAIWNDAGRAAVVLDGSEVTAGFAEDVRQRLVARLDDYAAAWAALHDEVCPIAMQRGRQSDADAAPRLACVDDRLAVFGGVVDHVTSRRPAALRVDALLDALPPIDECRHVDAASWKPVPADPELAAQVVDARARLRDLGIRYRADPWRPIGDEIGAVVADARRIGYPYLLAETLVVQAAHSNDNGDVDGAVRHTNEALATALAAGHDRLAARAAVLRVGVVSANPDLGEDTRHWESLARALLERSGNDDTTLGELELHVGRLAYERGDLQRAVDHRRLALSHFTRAFGPDHPATASTQAALAQSLTLLGFHDEAWALASEAEGLFERAHGPNHPSTAGAIQALGVIAATQGRNDDAIERLSDALDRTARVYPARSRVVSVTAFNLATPLAVRGRLAEARAVLARSRDAWPVADDDVSEAEFLHTEATIDLLEGNVTDALVRIDRALALYEPHAEANAGAAGSAAVTRARILARLGRCRETLDTLEAQWGQPSRAALFGGTNALDGIECGVAVGDRARAVLWLARLEALPLPAPSDIDVRPFGRALAGGSRSPEVVAMIRRDRDEMVAKRFPTHPEVLRIDAWLAGE